MIKACLQSIIGSIFSATFEAASLAAKAGIDGEMIVQGGVYLRCGMRGCLYRT